jgi:adenylosuccinate synthase
MDYEVLEVKLRRLEDGYRKRFGDLLKYDVEEELARFKVCDCRITCNSRRR